jgi:molybdopterin converting factor subunit 1
MRVTVRLFAQLRDAAGLGAWEADMRPGAVVGDVWRAVSARHPEIAPFEQAVSCAVNANFARMTQPIADGDEVAFLPPVSGG